jgi:hypothetical protein
MASPRALAALVLLAGCQSPFAPSSLIEGLRVLAVKAEPPELAPGETSTLTVLAAETNQKNPVMFDWARCNLAPGPTDPAINRSCILPPADGPSPLTPLTGATEVNTLSTPSHLEQLAVTMPQVTADQLGLPDYTLGVYVPYRVTASAFGVGSSDMGADQVMAFYRLRLATGLEARNHNPRIHGVYEIGSPDTLDAGSADWMRLHDLQDQPVVIAAQQQLRLRALLDIDSIENFLILDGDPRLKQFKLVEEQPRVLWYASAGSFDHAVTGLDDADVVFTLDDNSGNAPIPPPQSTIYFWIVVHDERGGTDFAARQIAVR